MHWWKAVSSHPSVTGTTYHGDVIKWKRFPRYWPFGRGWLVNSPHKGQWRGTLMVFFVLRSRKQWWGWWFETPSRPLWRHCNVLNTYTADTLPPDRVWKKRWLAGSLYTIMKSWVREIVLDQKQIDFDILLTAYIEACEHGVFSQGRHYFDAIRLYCICIFN